MRKRIAICLKVKGDEFSRLSPGFVCLNPFPSFSKKIKLCVCGM